MWQKFRLIFKWKGTVVYCDACGKQTPHTYEEVNGVRVSDLFCLICWPKMMGRR